MSSWAERARRVWSETSHRLHGLPVVVLMPHSRCNCRCVMCDIWKANKTRHEITAEDLRPHLDTLRRLRTRWVVLSGGEPLMHSNLWRLCAALRDLGCRITLLSTGLLLRRHRHDVTRWCDDVIVSLDGPREIHDAIRNVPRAFDQLADGVAALRETAPDYRVTGRSVVQRRNFRALPDTVAAAREIGLDQISFLAADVSSEAFNRPRPWDDERVGDVALSATEADELVPVLERLIDDRADDIRSGFIAESPEKLRHLGRYFLAHHGRGDFPPIACNAPWVSTVIEADGTVRPCFFHRPYGNLADASLGDLLDSPSAVGFRRQLDIRRDPICRRCVCTLKL